MLLHFLFKSVRRRFVETQKFKISIIFFTSFITRSKVKSEQTLDHVASPRANPPGSASASNKNITQQLSHEGSVSSNTQDPEGHLTTSFTAGNERQPEV